ncbi:hypothetical protein SDC9_144577 [bioreactor metagenome]|uniref:Uncharacterized protein n=1 Tax=bioreactor metagenome TaxID=1076179 RepID=A0A645E6F2_9ZZZZ
MFNQFVRIKLHVFQFSSLDQFQHFVRSHEIHVHAHRKAFKIRRRILHVGQMQQILIAIDSQYFFMRSVFQGAFREALIDYSDVAFLRQMVLHNGFDVDIGQDFAAHNDDIFAFGTGDELFVVHIKIWSIAILFLDSFQQLLRIGENPAGQTGLKVPCGSAADVIIDRTAASGNEHAH